MDVEASAAGRTDGEAVGGHNDRAARRRFEQFQSVERAIDVAETLFLK